MKAKARLIIFILVILAVGAIFIFPYINSGNSKSQQFAVTPQPAVELQRAAAKGRPVFLEFWGGT